MEKQLDDLRPLAEVLAGLTRVDEIESVLTAMLTPAERVRLALRWRLVCLLAKGVAQREIARNLGVSLCKITRGSRELKRGSGSFGKVVERFVRREQGGSCDNTGTNLKSGCC